MATKKKLSVFIITYNQESYIQQCIESALNQNFDNYEIVISDDCSTDKTQQICEHYQQKYPDLIRYIRRDVNLGLTKNWVETLKLCRGEYVAICEGDDYWIDENKLYSQVEFLDSNPNYVITCHNSKIVNEGTFENSFNTKEIPSTTDINYLLDHSFYIPTASVVFRNGIDFQNLTSEYKNMDYLTYLLLTSQGGLINYSDRLLSVYRKHPGGISNNFLKNNISYHRSMILIFQRINKQTNGLYFKKCLTKVESHTFEILKNLKVYSKDFWKHALTLISFSKFNSSKFFKYLVLRILKLKF